MGKYVEFDLKGLEKELDLIQKVHLPEAGRQALKSFGFEARELLQREMAAKYISATSFTLRSAYFKLDDLTLQVGISDKANGVPPKSYLAPTDRTGGVARKELQPTSFAGALRARYGIDEVPIPVRSSRAGAQFLDKRGNVKGRKVQALLDNLNDRPEQVRLVGGRNALHDGRDPLEPHTGIDARRREQRPGAILRLVELREH